MEREKRERERERKRKRERESYLHGLFDFFREEFVVIYDIRSLFSKLKKLTDLMGSDTRDETLLGDRERERGRGRGRERGRGRGRGREREREGE